MSKQKRWKQMRRRQCHALAGRTLPDRSLWVAGQIGRLSFTPFGQAYREAIDKGDWAAILAMKVPEASSYGSNFEAFGTDYLLAELLSKVAPGVTGASPEFLSEVALAKFSDSEDQCRETNHRFARDFSRLGVAEFDPITRLARRKIERVLGRFSWDEVSKHFAHGSHASTRLNRAHGDLYYKFGGIPDTTALCETLSKIAIASIRPWQKAEPENWSDCKVNLVVGNRITTVPKTAKTDRTIAIEPCMNMYIQKGIGKVIRSRLRRTGIELNDQGVNQMLAREGSQSGLLATIDLSSASDCISLGVVQHLLPPEWFDALYMTRSSHGVWPDGTVKRYQKFSTMGNGYTFELESLIFWALCSAVVDNLGLSDKRIGVYGDDLIVNVEAYESLTYTLTYYGFTQNTKKSYATGPFRESCGKHWFLGRDVSPFYIREGVVDVTRELLVVNNFRRWANRLYNGFIPPRVWDVYVTLRDSLIPENWVRDIKISDGFGDLGLVSSFEEALPQRLPGGQEGWSCETLQITPTPRKIIERRRVDGESVLTKGLFLLEKRNSEEDEHAVHRALLLNASLGPTKSGGEAYADEIPIHSRRLQLKTSKLHVGRWEDVGFPLI